jgi:hypothetical protein
VDSVLVYYPQALKVKEGCSHIRIKLRGLLFWRWLEIEGAMAIADYN